METPQPVVIKKRTFLSTAALGFAILGSTFILSGTAVILYGMNIADRKSSSLADAAADLFRGLPELQKSLPPALADLLDDRRQPEYVREIEVSARIATGAGAEEGRLGTALDIRNRGTEVVSLLSLRIVVLGENGDPVAEWNEWAATPLAADDDWRGPLLPGTTRHILTRTHRLSRRPLRDSNKLKVEVEVTDVRIWRGEGPSAKDRHA